MKDIRQIRANERIKAVSTTLFNLGGALIAAAMARTYFHAAFDADAGLWLIIGGLILYVAWLMLGLLEAEE